MTIHFKTPDHRPKQLRQPRLGEVVADYLRKHILNGRYSDGEMLPKQEDIVVQLQASPDAVREGVRVLETEGLVSIQRGNRGGAIVHQPQPTKAAYMLSLVLESRNVPIDAVQRALRQLEPACAASCAARADRAEEVLPFLRSALDSAFAAIDDPGLHISYGRQFHAELVARCGNDAMALVVGALEAIWSAHVDSLARRADNFGSFARREVRVSTLEQNEKIYACIASGDVEGAERITREFFSARLQEKRGWRLTFDMSRIVDSGLLRFLHMA